MSRQLLGTRIANRNAEHGLDNADETSLCIGSIIMPQVHFSARKGRRNPLAEKEKPASLGGFFHEQA